MRKFISKFSDLNSNLYTFLKFAAYLNLKWKNQKNRNGNWADSRQPSCTQARGPLAQCSVGDPWLDQPSGQGSPWPALVLGLALAPRQLSRPLGGFDSRGIPMAAHCHSKGFAT
jgi:hypothetical protein